MASPSISAISSWRYPSTSCSTKICLAPSGSCAIAVSMSIEVSGAAPAPATVSSTPSPSRYRCRWIPRRSRRPRITLMASRWSQVPKAASPRKVPSFSQARTNTSWAASSASSSLSIRRARLWIRLMCPRYSRSKACASPLAARVASTASESDLGDGSRRSFTGPGRVRVIARYWIGLWGERLQREVARRNRGTAGRWAAPCHPERSEGSCQGDDTRVPGMTPMTATSSPPSTRPPAPPSRARAGIRKPRSGC